MAVALAEPARGKDYKEYNDDRQKNKYKDHAFKKAECDAGIVDARDMEYAFKDRYAFVQPQIDGDQEFAELIQSNQ